MIVTMTKASHIKVFDERTKSTLIFPVDISIDYADTTGVIHKSNYIAAPGIFKKLLEKLNASASDILHAAMLLF